MNIYQVYGMKVLSDICLKQLNTMVIPQGTGADIYIMEGNIPEQICELTPGHWKVSKAESWMVCEHGVILVREGRYIYYKPSRGGDPDCIRNYLLGYGMAMLAHQKGQLALHCSVIADSKGAILIAGDSGAGKSTLTDCFIKDGYSFMTDDMAILDVSEGALPIVYPAFPYRKLCRDTALEQGYDVKKMLRINEERDKFLVSGKKHFISVPRYVKGMILLCIKQEKEVTAKNAKGVEAFQVILNQFFLKHLASEIVYIPDIGKLGLDMAATVPVFCISRPKEKKTTYTVYENARSFAEKCMR